MPRPGTPVVHPDMLGEIRSSAVAGLVDACRITDPATAGDRVYDPATRRTTGGEPATVYDGPCAVQPRAAESANTQFGQQATHLRGYQAAVPIAVTGVERGHTFTFTAVGPDGDPRLVGRAFTVADVTADSYGVLRMLELEETGRG